MTLLRTDKDTLSEKDITDWIERYEAEAVPKYNDLWDYYLGKNPKIIKKKSPDPNNPDNRTPVSYARKIITTFTGYAYRPHYITYKSDNEPYLAELQDYTFNESNEHIKTSQHGRNTGIFGVAYELLYIAQGMLSSKAEVKLAVIDPREMILLYNYDLEPKKMFAIRFYPITEELWKVIVYAPDSVTYYDAKREKYTKEIQLTQTGAEPNFFGEVPVVAYYLGPDMQGIIEPVVPLIDDYDTLVSDSMNEFDRFSHAYLRLVGMSLSDQTKSQAPGVFKQALALIKQRRVFEQLKDKEDVSFLTKDIPTEYIQFMTTLIREQIHVQSHVPDLGKDAEMSGIAIQRLMFDFENVVSSAEAEFDTGLYERIRMITAVYKKTGRPNGSFDEITISHKRNAPLNLKEFADTALVMSQAGFSRYLQADIMPDDIVPDVEDELKRQDEEREAAMPDPEMIPEAEEDDDGNA
jgi:SPP1 family phage portal protein